MRKRRIEMETILKTVDLTKKYDNRTVVDNLNLEIGKGEVFGLLGPNGAGKSTTMNMICNLIKPDFGTVEFMGKDFRKNKKELSGKLGYILSILQSTEISRHGRMSNSLLPCTG